MKLIEILGEKLKGPILCDLFETYNVEVIYRYDRLNEDTPDDYSAELFELGLEFIFDESQKLKTLFVEPKKNAVQDIFFNNDKRLKKFKSKKEAKNFASKNNVTIVEGVADFMGQLNDWVRLDYENYSAHYGFIDTKLDKITLQLAHA